MQRSRRFFQVASSYTKWSSDSDEQYRSRSVEARASDTKASTIHRRCSRRLAPSRPRATAAFTLERKPVERPRVSVTTNSIVEWRTHALRLRHRSGQVEEDLVRMAS